MKVFKFTDLRTNTKFCQPYARIHMDVEIEFLATQSLVRSPQIYCRGEFSKFITYYQMCSHGENKENFVLRNRDLAKMPCYCV